MTVTSFSHMLGKHPGLKFPGRDYIKKYRSSVVEKVLLRAHAERKNFSVIVVDSRPLLEGEPSDISISQYTVHQGIKKGSIYYRS